VATHQIRADGAACPFCESALELRAVATRPEAIAILDGYPVNEGHTLLIPRRHVSRWADTTASERRDLLELLDEAQVLIGSRYPSDGFNIGINEGAAAGQTVGHLHIHVIPRVHGDVPDPRGGIRHVVPARGNYLVAGESTPSHAPHSRAVISGGERDPFLPHLESHLLHATRFDFAVAFILSRGWALLDAPIRALLEAGGQVRLLTGDYMGSTEPEALEQIVDLSDAYGDRCTARVYEASRRAFHPKVYLLHSERGSVGFVGSSNISQSALERGVEWNYRMVSPSYGETPDWRDACEQFEELFTASETRPLTRAWIEEYSKRRGVRDWGRTRVAASSVMEELPMVRDEPLDPVLPRAGFQEEALVALEDTRVRGNGAGLVVLATGLGKTFLAAFDALRPEFGKVLFIAHREEILRQAQRAFRRVRPSLKMGLFTGGEKNLDAEVVFASIQALSRPANLQAIPSREFSYIVVDEFHHADAATYRRVLDHFDPEFLLGLTATPERSDGGDLLALCGENLAYRADLAAGIEAGQLCPFHYYGVPDEVDYSQIPWRSGRFDESRLTEEVATQRRAQNALEQLRKHGGSKTLAFCVSIRHADFMTKFFADSGLRAMAVHSGEGSADRRSALDDLGAGRLDVICTVDMFNEGVDLPAIDTVLLLRPTESTVLWLQQVGRGLRIDPEDRGKHLNVIDYVGNHKAFLTAFESLFGLGRASNALRECIQLLQKAEPPELPPGCNVTYELKALEILEELTRPKARGKAAQELERLTDWVKQAHGALGRRPRAVEAFHEGFSLKKILSKEPWLEFLSGLNELGEHEARVLTNERSREFLEVVAKTSMTKSYKMVVLQAWVRYCGFPSPVSIDALTEGVQRLVRRLGTLAFDFSVDPADTDLLRAILIKNPVKAWTGTGSGGGKLLGFEGDTLRCLWEPHVEDAVALAALTEELSEWRLAVHLESSRKDRTYRLFDASGAAVDAHFSVEAAPGELSVFLESRGGAGGTKQARNTEYSEGLRLLLERVRDAQLPIQVIELATKQVTGEALQLSKKFPLLIPPEEDLVALRREIQRAQGNNETRRIRIAIAVQDSARLHSLPVALARGRAGGIH
jgi:superfamily II DNA or RNA helicase/diadenosine tetraphosphate (Ap4A) HIT family hydrolase/HKD family nuclease